MEGSAASQVHVDGFDICDNLSNSETLTAQTQNLNETLAQTLPLPQNDEGGMCGKLQKPSLDNNGKEEEEEETGVEEYSEGSRDEDEEMKEEEEEESEASSSLICCRSPDTPMTDSSYSETGSLLETPYPFSPGTSPEPTSPDVPAISPVSLHPGDLLEASNSSEEVGSSTTNPGLVSTAVETVSCRQGDSAGLASNVTTSGTRLDSPPGPRCNTVDSERMDSCPEPFTSTKEPVSICGSAFTGPTSSSTSGPVIISPELNTLLSVTTEPSAFATGSNTTATEITTSPLPTSSKQEQFTSNYNSVLTCSTGSILSPTFLASLEQMAERDDYAQLPRHLHQIAENFVLQKDYQRALLFIQLEQLYHQRVLENLNALQEQWVSQCGGTSPELGATHLDSLKHFCQTHTRPRTRHAEVGLLDNLSLKVDRVVSRSSCISTNQVKGGMEQSAEDSSCPTTLSANLLERLSLPETDREQPDGKSERICFGSELTGRQAYGREVEGGVECSTSAPGNGLHPFTDGGMERSNPAEQQEEDLGPAREAELKEEEISEVEEAAEALEMEEEETEDDGEDKRGEQDSHLCQRHPSVETLVSGAELELHRKASAQEKLHSYQETPEDSETCLNQEAPPSQEADPEQQEPYAEEEEDYEADFRRAPSLDYMAKLITVEEVVPASGLVSILKKQSVYVDNQTSSTDPEPRPEKPAAKRRVRFKVPDDSYDHDVGGGDSCLLLFLLCLVTVVISVGGTALYCALGDAQSSVCQDFSRNADFYISQIRRGITRLQHWYTSGF